MKALASSILCLALAASAASFASAFSGSLLPALHMRSFVGWHPPLPSRHPLRLESGAVLWSRRHSAAWIASAAEDVALDFGATQRVTVIVDASNAGLLVECAEGAGAGGGEVVTNMKLASGKGKGGRTRSVLNEVEALGGALEEKGGLMRIVFDGKHQGGSYAGSSLGGVSGCEILFTALDETADDAIVRMLTSAEAGCLGEEARGSKHTTSFEEAQSWMRKKKTSDPRWLVLTRKAGLRGSTASKKSAETTLSKAGLGRPGAKVALLPANKALRSTIVQILGGLKSLASAEKVVGVESLGRLEREVVVVSGDVGLSHRVWTCGGLVMGRAAWAKWLQDFGAASSEGEEAAS